jgi:hypothetical protein
LAKTCCINSVTLYNYQQVKPVITRSDRDQSIRSV